MELKVSRGIVIEDLSWGTKAAWNIFWRSRECWYVLKSIPGVNRTFLADSSACDAVSPVPCQIVEPKETPK